MFFGSIQPSNQILELDNISHVEMRFYNHIKVKKHKET